MSGPESTAPAYQAGGGIVRTRVWGLNCTGLGSPGSATCQLCDTRHLSGLGNLIWKMGIIIVLLRLLGLIVSSF